MRFFAKDYKMKYTGFMYFTGYVLEDGIVTDAVLTANRLGIDWREDGYVGHLSAETIESNFFRGTAEYKPGSWGAYQSELRLFRSEKDVLLFGTWRSNISGEEGRWTFVLTPQK